MSAPRAKQALFLMLGLAAVLAWIGVRGAAKEATPAPIAFAVISDPHLYDTRLGISGHAFEATVAQDVKMVAQSGVLLARALELVAAQKPKPSFLLIAGDLTHEGEASSHRLMASYLAGLRAQGIQPYVIPGNHDINNPAASAYDQQGAHPVQGISAEEFADIYAPFGYQQAIARDPHSLSYIAEPVPGYWLFALDSCRYSEGNMLRIDAGRLRPESLKWLLGKLDEARELGKQPLGMMHHGVLEHSLGQAQNFPDFVLKDGDSVGQSLAESGLQLMFTGHTHNQNITRKAWHENPALLDVQTGSLVTFPNPLRFVAIDPARATLAIHTQRILSLPGNTKTEHLNFSAASHAFTAALQSGIVAREMHQRSTLPPSRHADLTAQIVSAAMASYAGDERPTLGQFNAALKLRNSNHHDETAIGNLMISLWHDLPPNDNNVELRLDSLDASVNKLQPSPLQRQAAR